MLQDPLPELKDEFTNVQLNDDKLQNYLSELDTHLRKMEQREKEVDTETETLGKSCTQ